jgi:restriction system protein
MSTLTRNVSRKSLSCLKPPRHDEGAEDTSEDEERDDRDQDAPNWQDTLIGQLLTLSPQAFERLCQRLLRESGFTNVQVTGRPNDGGIDGVGVYSLSLVSFRTFFQAKRYQGTVSSGAVQDFRGAMAGRGEKGLLITTGSFTREAVAEASREGAPPIELIDGNRLTDLLKEHRLGVSVAMVEDVAIDEDFFEDL